MCVFLLLFHSIAIWPPPTYFPHVLPPSAPRVLFFNAVAQKATSTTCLDQQQVCMVSQHIHYISLRSQGPLEVSTSEEDTCKSGAHLVGWRCEMLFPPQEMCITRAGAPNNPKITHAPHTVVSHPFFAPQPPTDLTAMSNQEQLPQVSDNLNPTRTYSRMYLRFQ